MMGVVWSVRAISASGAASKAMAMNAVKLKKRGAQRTGPGHGGLRHVGFGLFNPLRIDPPKACGPQDRPPGAKALQSPPAPARLPRCCKLTQPRDAVAANVLAKC